MTSGSLFLYLVLYFLNSVSGSLINHPDLVRDLPGAPAEPSFPLYSGYLTFHLDETQHNIFYILCESIQVPHRDAPLVVWLNGGPGSSSLLGFALEHGPYLLDSSTGELRYNDLSWNQYTNVLYLESPTGVGFSYSNRSIERFDDILFANITKAAIHTFMTRTHHRYASRDFYITGESYAGVYIPFLTRGLLEGMRDGSFENKNLKGIAIGNGGIEYYTREVSRAMQMAAMGMLPDKDVATIFEIWNNLSDTNVGNVDYALPISYFFTFNDLPGESPYNLVLVCERDEGTKSYHIAPPIKDIDCTMIKNVERYFNREDVQESLNVLKKRDEMVDWEHSSDIVFNLYHRPHDTIPLYAEIFEMIETDFRILFYTGDLDLVCPAIHVARGTSLIAKKNDMKEIENIHKLWTHMGDFGGAQTSYKSAKKNITMDVLTIRGAGHLVPVNHPSQAFQIFNNFVSSKFSSIDYSAKIRRKKSSV